MMQTHNKNLGYTQTMQLISLYASKNMITIFLFITINLFGFE